MLSLRTNSPWGLVWVFRQQIFGRGEMIKTFLNRIPIVQTLRGQKFPISFCVAWTYRAAHHGLKHLFRLADHANARSPHSASLRRDAFALQLFFMFFKISSSRANHRFLLPFTGCFWIDAFSTSFAAFRKRMRTGEFVNYSTTMFIVAVETFKVMAFVDDSFDYE